MKYVATVRFAARPTERLREKLAADSEEVKKMYLSTHLDTCFRQCPGAFEWRIRSKWVTWDDAALQSHA
jgi:hypothetical protein